MQRKGENFCRKYKKIEISKNMPVKIRLPWKLQIAWTKKYHIELLHDKF